MDDAPVVMLGAAFAEALMAASAWHRDQGRKGSRLPYLGHLLAVASIVIGAGASETVAIAALLHDAIEDQPDRSGGIRGIESRFGREVATIVSECSDSDPSGRLKRDSTNWRARKQAYLDGLPHKSSDGLLVSLADKLDNARSIRTDLREHGEEVWGRFNAPKEDQIWYYRQLANTFARRLPGPLVLELERVVSEIERFSSIEAGPDRGAS
jgi:(p)ppGpp synthase/HD superfamily hydrolase